MARISRRRFMQTAAVTAGVTLAAPSVHTQQSRSTLRFVAHADLKVSNGIRSGPRIGIQKGPHLPTF
jgi:phosphodiesterase/alkaline phosphatase D-like protein